jgi:hypothetical protein
VPVGILDQSDQSGEPTISTPHIVSYSILYEMEVVVAK